MEFTNIAVADGKLIITKADGSTQTFVDEASVTTAPVVAPEDTEIDVVLSDGSVKKFVPAPAADVDQAA